MKKHNSFLTNKEWSKDIKFNNHWYHLTSLFDRGAHKDFDFNQELNDLNQDFIKLGKKSKRKHKKEDYNLKDINLNDKLLFDFNYELKNMQETSKL